MKLSIIIPIYNVEKYIERCLNSIYNQGISNEDFEIIAINDGSTDNSENILKEYSQKHNNITIINQSNKGVSAARNAGIEVAKNEFLTFVDGDDYIIDNSLLQINSYLKDDRDFELLILEREVLKVGQKKTKAYNSTNIKRNRLYTGKELFSKYKYLRGSSCGVIYKTTFIKSHKIKFPLNVKNSEDTIFANLCMIYAKKIKFYNLNFYKYQDRPESASNIIDSNTLNSYLIALQFCTDFADKQNLRDIDKAIFEYLKWGFISTFTTHAIQMGLTYKKIKSIKKLFSFIPLSSKFFPTGKLGVFILNNSYWLFYNLIKLKLH